MEKYNCSFGRYYNYEPVKNSKMEKFKNSKILRSLKRGFCGAGDDEDICKYTKGTVRLGCTRSERNFAISTLFGRN